jgi:D-amino-acid dehydrogenase
MPMKVDVLVLGAGIVGTSAALHLALRGRRVALVDRRGPGEETSHGNSGVVGRSGIHPMAFPRSLSALTAVARQRYPGARYHAGALPGLAPWLFAYWRASAPDKMAASARALAPLIASSLDEHRKLADLAGAEHYYRDGGWLKVYRSQAALDRARSMLALAREQGIALSELTATETLAAEPHLLPVFAGAIHWTDLRSVSSPGGVVKALAGALENHGGSVVVGDARTLRQDSSGWTVDGAVGPISAADAVVALGPWSMDVLRPIGYRMALAVKRGYHLHYAAKGNAVLSRPVLDEEAGYVITPMEKGIRLTTGSEFATRDAPKTPVQIALAEAKARELFPLATRLEAEPWMGSRPSFPDMLPAIGRGPRHKGLWLGFGHQHIGFTLGPPTGRLLAEMMTGETPFIDPAPFSPERF